MVFSVHTAKSLFIDHFGYFNRTIENGINYKRTDSDLEGYSDSDYAAELDRSQCTEIFVLSGGAVAWSSMK